MEPQNLGSQATQEVRGLEVGQEKTHADVRGWRSVNFVVVYVEGII